MALKEVWPGYETVERIGKGGYGTVYKVRKKDTAGEFYSAIKKISIPKDEDEYYALKDEDYTDENITMIFAKRMNRIIDEFKLMAKFKGLSHIVSYEDHMIVEHENGIGWDILIRMELLENLKKHFKNMDENDVIQLGIDMCKALEIIQKENIVHRDIKPENILVNAYGQYKLSDFGIAKTMDHATKATLAGTPDYIAPEVFHKQAYGFLADEYSLGLVLYWALNERRMPFIEIEDRPPADEEIQEAQKRRMNGESLPEPLHGNALLKKAVLKACAYNPEDRYQTITEFKRALKLCEGNDMPEEDVITEEIEETTEDFTSSETVGAWGKTEVQEETPIVFDNTEQEEIPEEEEDAEEAEPITERQPIPEKREDKRKILKKYLPKLEGKASFAPEPVVKTIDTLRKAYKRPDYAEHDLYRKSGTEDILDKQEILAAYVSKVNWSIPRLVLVFTKEEVVSLCPKFTAFTADGKIDYQYHFPYESIKPIEAEETGRLWLKDNTGRKYSLDYNPKNVNGQILFQLFKELSSSELNRF